MTVDGRDDSAAGLVAVADGWAAAIVANDAARIGEFMADEWVIVSDSGITSKEQFLGVIASGALTHAAMGRISEPRVRRYGDVGVLTARVTNTAHYQGRQFDADEWTTDIFEWRAGRWVCVLSQITAAA